MRMIVIAIIALACCSKPEAPAPDPAPAPAPISKPAPHLTKPGKDPAAAKQLISAGAVVVDVRTPDEYGEGHLPQATNIPVDDFAKRLAEVDRLVAGDKSKAVVVYCAAGSRAAVAKQQLEAAGYTRVVNGGG